MCIQANKHFTLCDVVSGKAGKLEFPTAVPIIGRKYAYITSERHSIQWRY